MGFMTRSSLCTTVLLAVAASVNADVIEVDIGTFRFQGYEHPFQYEGDYGQYVGSTIYERVLECCGVLEC